MTQPHNLSLRNRIRLKNSHLYKVVSQLSREVTLISIGHQILILYFLGNQKKIEKENWVDYQKTKFGRCLWEKLMGVSHFLPQNIPGSMSNSRFCVIKMFRNPNPEVRGSFAILNFYEKQEYLLKDLIYSRNDHIWCVGINVLQNCPTLKNNTSPTFQT